MIFHINLKIVKTFLSVFLFSQFNILYFNDFCSATTLCQNELNLKQKKNAKKDVLRFDYLLYFFFLTPSYWTAIPSKLACIHS